MVCAHVGSCILHNYCLSINDHKGGNRTDLLFHSQRQESSAPARSGASPSKEPQTRESSQNEASPVPYYSFHSCRHPFLTLNCHWILDITIIFVTLLHNNTRDLLIDCMMYYYYHVWYATGKHRGRRRTFTTKLTFRIIKSDDSPPVEESSPAPIVRKYYGLCIKIVKLYCDSTHWFHLTRQCLVIMSFTHTILEPIIA